jgi:hypothetical protein
LECLRRWATTETQSAQLAIQVLQLIEGTNGQTMDNQNSAVNQHYYGKSDTANIEIEKKLKNLV